MKKSGKIFTGFIVAILVLFVGISVFQREKAISEAEQREAQEIAQNFARNSEKAKLKEDLQIMRELHQKRLEEMTPEERLQYKKAEDVFSMFMAVGLQIAVDILTNPEYGNSDDKSHNTVIPKTNSSKN